MDNKSDKLEQIAEQVVRLCDGLTLAEFAGVLIQANSILKNAQTIDAGFLDRPSA